MLSVAIIRAFRPVSGRRPGNRPILTGPGSVTGPRGCLIPIANPEYMFKFTTIIFDESVIFQP
jgi:hypothetical protein